MTKSAMFILLAALAVLVAILIACGGAAEDAASAMPAPQQAQRAAMAESIREESGFPGLQGAPGEPGFPDNPGNPANPGPAGQPGPPSAPAARAPTAVPQPAAMAEKMVVTEVEVAKEIEDTQVGEFSEEQAALVAQNRIIVRTVNLQLEVDDVVDAIEEISQSVQQDGGWVVSTDRSSKHYGFIAVRVPAENLDAALQWMRQVGVDVLSEASTSTDVTDEYYDLRSRVDSLQATEEALIRLLDRAEKVEDALEVQRELAQLQVEIESHLGRIKLLEETAAFSLVNISLNLAPQDMRVDAGEDKAFSVGEIARFRAIFYPPEGIDDFRFTWDFGDGSTVENGSGSAPRADGGRITATIHHLYSSDLESPFIVEVTMTGHGEAGIVEGSDTFIATVTELPAITVFAGERRFVEEGEEVGYSGSFTRPEGLSNYQYSWEFSDGTDAVTGAPEEGATTVTAMHVYDNHRPQPFTVTLTVSAESETGDVEGSASFDVFVREAEGLVISGWSAGDNLKSAIRALSGFAQAAGTVAIWAVIFVPVWIVLGIIIYVIIRLRRRVRLNFRRRAPAELSVDEGNFSTVQDGDGEERV